MQDIKIGFNERNLQIRVELGGLTSVVCNKQQ